MQERVLPLGDADLVSVLVDGGRDASSRPSVSAPEPSRQKSVNCQSQVEVMRSTKARTLAESSFVDG